MAGVGLTGYIPSAFQSLVENNFPNREIVTATLFCLFANIFSQAISGLNLINFMNISGTVLTSLSMLLPFIYVIICHETSFRRHQFQKISDRSDNLKIEIASDR